MSHSLSPVLHGGGSSFSSTGCPMEFCLVVLDFDDGLPVQGGRVLKDIGRRVCRTTVADSAEVVIDW